MSEFDPLRRLALFGSIGERPEEPMKLPIRNRTALPLTLFIEPYCDQHEIPPNAEAIVILADSYPHSMDFHSGLGVAVG